MRSDVGLGPQSYHAPMTSVVVGEHPDFDAWLARRRAQGLDGRDEVWEGVYRVAPHEHARNGLVAMRLVVTLDGPTRHAGLHAGGSFNLGEPDDYRVPDLGYHRSPHGLGAFVPTAALVLEVLSPGDDSEAKLPFYARHGVEEVWLVDPLRHSIEMHVLTGTAFAPSRMSPLLDVTAEHVGQLFDWA